MTTSPTFFDLPNSPDEFGVVLPPSNLRRLDFSGLDFTTARRAIIEYIKTYFPDDFNDFIASNGIMMIMEIIASTTGKLSLRSDVLANEGTLPTAKTEEAVVNHLALINQRIKRQTPAITDIEVTIDQPAFSDIEIAAGTAFSVSGSDGAQVTYEIYRAPADWTSKVVIPAGKRGVIAYGLEGRFASAVTVTSAGGGNQQYTIQDNNILESPLMTMIQVGSSMEEWFVVTEPIEKYGPTEKVVEAIFIQDRVIFRFGDNLTGQAPLSGSLITFHYRVGGGIRGRIGVGQIDSSRQVTPLPPANAPVNVRFRNISPSSGGTDRESLEKAKKRAPRDFALQRSIVTADDYAQAATGFAHPVFGAIAKAVASIRTGLNANRVEIYALVAGPDGLPMAPNAGLKEGLITYFDDLNVLTDHTVVLDGALRPVNVEMTVVINRNADASVVKERVEAAVVSYFELDRWEMGHPFYISNFIEAVEAIDGIAYVDLFKPTNNILPVGTAVAGPDQPDGVGFAQLIVAGKRTINYYYERNPPPGGIRNGR
jgi:hypothetical protein